MTILDAFAVHNAEQVEVPSVRVELSTPCGVTFTTEPMYNCGTDKYDSVLYEFATGEKIIVDSGLDSFHDAYLQYTGKEFWSIQIPIETEVQ